MSGRPAPANSRLGCLGGPVADDRRRLVVMKVWLPAALIAALVVPALAQEQEPKVPDDSTRVTIRGCARDRVLIVAPRSEDQPGTLEIAPGRRFRLSGPKDLLEGIKRAGKNQSMVLVTGLVRKNSVGGPAGIPVFGGRVRIGGAMPQAGANDPATDPAYNQAGLDVESWQPLPDNCNL